jgi:hypothetical protein
MDLQIGGEIVVPIRYNHLYLEDAQHPGKGKLRENQRD